VASFPVVGGARERDLPSSFASRTNRPAGMGNADPTVFEDVHGKGGAAGCEVGVHAEIVVDASECGVDGRGFGFALGGIGFHAQGAVFRNRDNYPAGRMVCVLRFERTGGAKCEHAECCEEQSCFLERAGRHNETAVRGKSHRLYLT